MPPELFSNTATYGPEVDIWAFGAMMYEIATGAPPFAKENIGDWRTLGESIRKQVPRLEGDEYSNELKSIVAYCLQSDPGARPPVEKLQRHPYIYNTASKFPTSSLSHLVRAFRLWEDRGGNRKSLFMAGGAQGPSQVLSTAMSDDEWNFSTTDVFDQQVRRQSTIEDFYDAYGKSAELESGAPFNEGTARPPASTPGRRRPPPKALAPLKAPIEKLFDVDTTSNYKDDSDMHYNRAPMPATSATTSDLPLRTDSMHNTIRDTMIDLGDMDPETGMSSFPEQTLKPNQHNRGLSYEDRTVTAAEFSQTATQDLNEFNMNRRTQDWKFPSMAPDASDFEAAPFPPHFELPRPELVPAPGGRPALIHHPTEPIGGFNGLANSSPVHDRMSMRDSLIDLDLSLPDDDDHVIQAPGLLLTRPSTAYSDTGSATSEADTETDHSTTGDAFELERHMSIYQSISGNRAIGHASQQHTHINGNSIGNGTDSSDPSSSELDTDADVTPAFDPHDYAPRLASLAGYTAARSRNRGRGGSSMSSHTSGLSSSSSTSAGATSASRNPSMSSSMSTGYLGSELFKVGSTSLPPPPNGRVMMGIASQEETIAEVTRMMDGLRTELGSFARLYEDVHGAQATGRGGSRMRGRAQRGARGA